MFSSRGRRRISWRGAENRAQLKSFKATPVSLSIDDDDLDVSMMTGSSRPVNYVETEISGITILQVLEQQQVNRSWTSLQVKLFLTIPDDFRNN